MTTYFVSGHLDLSFGEFDEHYVPSLTKALESGHAHFVVGDAPGTDSLAQAWLKERGADCTVYHMLTTPRYNAGFPTRGGFASDKERDTAMTLATYEDLAWVRPGREKSGTAKNLRRRKDIAEGRGPKLDIEVLDQKDHTLVQEVFQMSLRRISNNMAFLGKYEAAYCLGNDECGGYFNCYAEGGIRLTEASLEKCRTLQGIPGTHNT